VSATIYERLVASRLFSDEEVFAIYACVCVAEPSKIVEFMMRTQAPAIAVAYVQRVFARRLAE
jgi:hypothetical protein